MKRAPRNANAPRSTGTAAGAYATERPVVVGRRVKVTAIPCPTCGAKAGETCVSVGPHVDATGSTVGHGKGGSPLPCGHTTRRRMAIRADNQARAAAGTLSPSARTRGALEDDDGPECPECHLRIRARADGNPARHTTAGGRPSLKTPACRGSL